VHWLARQEQQSQFRVGHHGKLEYLEDRVVDVQLQNNVVLKYLQG
jgi:hypothetical protein